MNLSTIIILHFEFLKLYEREYVGLKERVLEQKRTESHILEKLILVTTYFFHLNIHLIYFECIYHSH